jgi:hypothetical protein
LYDRNWHAKQKEKNMTKKFIARGAFALALFTITLAPSATADEWDNQTVVTVQGGSIEIQGTVLGPGKYVLKLLDSPSYRRILEVFNGDETKLEATILANAAYRAHPTGKTAFTYYEMSAGHPPAIREWFPPGNTSGLEFQR